jgi:hypothetical protein
MGGAMTDRPATLRPDRRVLLVVATLLVVSLAWVLPRALRPGAPAASATTAAATPAPAAAAPAAGATLPAPLGQASAPARLTPPLAPGTVALAAGAFADRARFEQLAVRAGRVPAVTGSVAWLGGYAGARPAHVVVALQADFYDAAGNQTGAGTATVRRPTTVALAEDAGGRRAAFGFQVSADAPAPGAVAARLAVRTVLVEED